MSKVAFVTRDADWEDVGYNIVVVEGVPVVWTVDIVPSVVNLSDEVCEFTSKVEGVFVPWSVTETVVGEGCVAAL